MRRQGRQGKLYVGSKKGEGRSSYPTKRSKNRIPFLRSRLTEELALVQERRVGANMRHSTILAWHYSTFSPSLSSRDG